jgi:hypothetical protein
MNVLWENLKDLHFILKSQKSAALFNPISIVSDINDFCLKITSEDFGISFKFLNFYQGLCSSILFDKELGLFHFSDQSLIEGRQNQLLVKNPKKLKQSVTQERLFLTLF